MNALETFFGMESSAKTIGARDSLQHSEQFKSGGMLTDGFVEQFYTTNSKTQSMSEHAKLD